MEKMKARALLDILEGGKVDFKQSMDEEELFKESIINIKPESHSLQNEKGIIMAKELLKILKKSPKDSSGKNSTALQNKITRLSIEILGISDIMEE